MTPKIDVNIKNIIKRDKKIMLTTTRVDYPFIPKKGSGEIIYDISDNMFIDFSSFISVYNLGINNKEVENAIKTQAIPQEGYSFPNGHL